MELFKGNVYVKNSKRMKESYSNWLACYKTTVESMVMDGLGEWLAAWHPSPHSRCPQCLSISFHTAGTPVYWR